MEAEAPPSHAEPRVGEAEPRVEAQLADPLDLAYSVRLVDAALLAIDRLEPDEDLSLAALLAWRDRALG